ncbi:MAG TPA: DEAD/DEAH box helicase [Candidatus Competibacteraceae bacterium]|nr:DEAD/DEAH box helicase [Candidatus Competibacteraceae bacterium]
MFMIERHGVPLEANGLSATQNLLARPDTAPILVIGAPTGAGKTFGFQKLIKNTGSVVLFIVPTQALARNICESLEREDLYAKQWDSQQTCAAVERGISTWTERLHSLTVEARQRGGMIVATLEAFHGITLGRPAQSKTDFDVQDVLTHVDWLVFDEAHLLNERAMGFMALWATLVGFRRQCCGGRTRLALLSATHSAWVDFLVRRDENNLISLPPEWVDYQTETIVDLPATAKAPPEVRPMHGEVSVELHPGEIRELAAELIPALLGRHRRVLLVYDSLAEFGLDESLLLKVAQTAGLQREQMFVVNSQDKQAGETLGSARIPAGWEIPDHSRLIIGTSAVEVGMNLAYATALVTDEGFNAAALLQRIGRAARGDLPGEAHVVCNAYRKAPHIHRLESLSGTCSIGTVVEQLKSPSLIPFCVKRARLLGSAYLDMLARQNRNLSKGLNAVLTEIENREGQRPLSGRSLLGLARREVEEFRGRLASSLKKWLEAIDEQLRDLRGFTPTVKVQFRDTQVIQCSLDFAEKRLPVPDELDRDSSGNTVLVYRRPRDQCLKERAEPIPVVQVITPFGRGKLQNVWNEADLQEKYRLLICNDRDSNRKELEHVVRFATASGLVPRVPVKTANVEQSGSMVI